MKFNVKKFVLILLITCFVILFSGCGFNSGIALMKIESSTKTSWTQSHDFLSGTEKRTLSLGKEPHEMKIEVVTEEGEIDFIITDRKGEEIIVLEDAKTGTYEFTAEGKIRITVKAEGHRGSFNINKADS